MEKKKLNLETALKKATIEMLLLNLLKEQDMYGYQLSQELKKKKFWIIYYFRRFYVSDSLSFK